MKLSLISVTAFCISLSGLPAWANALEIMPTAMPPVVPSMPPTLVMPPAVPSLPPGSFLPETTDSAAVEPTVLSTDGSAADLMVEERSPSAPTADRTQAFNLTAEQINQNLADPSEQESSPLGALGQRLSLPEGMVVRGLNRGGVAIGSELP